MVTGLTGREKPNLINYRKISDAVPHSIVRSKLRKLLWVTVSIERYITWGLQRLT